MGGYYRGSRVSVPTQDNQNTLYHCNCLGSNLGLEDSLDRSFIGWNPHFECNSEGEMRMLSESLGSCNTACSNLPLASLPALLAPDAVTSSPVWTLNSVVSQDSVPISPNLLTFPQELSSVSPALLPPSTDHVESRVMPRFPLCASFHVSKWQLDVSIWYFKGSSSSTFKNLISWYIYIKPYQLLCGMARVSPVL